MIAQQLVTTTSPSDQQEHLLRTLEAVLAERDAWHRARALIRVQLMSDFRLVTPTQKQARHWLQEFALIAEAIRHVAAQIEAEVEDVVNEYHTWLTD